MVVVPRRFVGRTVVCLGSGPSLTPEDLALVAASGHPTIAVNDTYARAPWADVIFAADPAWWHQHPIALLHPATKYTLEYGAPVGVLRLVRTGQTGLERAPYGLRSGGHSGYAAVNLAFLSGARCIILLGYDMQPAADGRHHYFGDHPDGSHPRYVQWLDGYATLVHELGREGVRLCNASRVTAITAVPRVRLEDELT